MQTWSDSVTYNIGGNYRHDRWFFDNDWKCVGCIRECGDGGQAELETQDHVATNCPAYKDLREQNNVETDRRLIFHLVAYVLK